MNAYSSQILNQQSNIRQESGSKINYQMAPPNGSTILNNQQFLQSTNIHIQGPSNPQPPSSSVYNNYNLMNSRPLVQVQKNSQMNGSNCNDNWTEIDYKREFSEWRNVIQQHFKFVQHLENVRLEMPKIQVIMKDIQKLKQNILQLSNCQKWAIFQEQIKPMSNEIQELTMQLEQSLNSLKENNQIPNNPYKQAYQETKAVSSITSFQTQLFNVKTAISNYLQQLDSLLDERKSVLNQQENYQQQLERASSGISDYLRNQLSQSVQDLIFIQEREVFNLNNTVNQHLHQEDMTSITYFLEKLQIIDGQMNLFQEKKKQIKIYKDEFNNILKQSISNFDSYFEQVTQFYTQYKAFYEEIKYIKQIPNEPILQSFQIKIKSQIHSLAQQLWQQAKQLYYNGERIRNFNFSEKLHQFKEFNVEAEVQYIIQCIQELQMRYIKKGASVPIEEAKKVKELLFKAECSYQQTNNIRKELNYLSQQNFYAYKEYILNQLTPPFVINFGQLYATDFYEIIHFQYADVIGIQTVKELMSFKFPLFDWNEEIADEEERIKLVQNQQQEAEEQWNLFIDNYSKDMKFMKQLNNWRSELKKCCSILQQYINIKKQLKGKIITLIKWPSIELLEIQEFSVHCEQICRQANSYVQAIKQLNEMNLIAQVQELLQYWNPLVKDKVHEICTYIYENTFSPVISEQVMIAYQYLYLCHECMNKDLDETFCQTSTYAEFEEMMCGRNKLQEIKNQYTNNIFSVEVRYKLFEILDQFMKEKIVLDFQQLFDLKLKQSQEKTSDYNPTLLSKRTDLLYPINRVDINTNEYCQQNMRRIEQIIDQPELREAFNSFRELLKQITIIMDQDILESDIQINQTTIIELINSFNNSLMIQNELTNVQPMIAFHQQLMKNAKQFLNVQVNLGIVLNEEYQKYLKSCRQRILRMRSGTIYEQQSTLIINGVQYNINEVPYIYKDANTLILE